MSNLYNKSRNVESFVLKKTPQTEIFVGKSIGITSGAKTTYSKVPVSNPKAFARGQPCTSAY